MAVDLANRGGDLVPATGAVARGRARRATVRIAGIVERRPRGLRVGRTLDATGKLVLPGMVDVHVHTGSPASRTRRTSLPPAEPAAAGGVTTIFGMPNLDPPTSSGQRSTRCRAVRRKVDRRLEHQRGRDGPGEIAGLARPRDPRVQGLHGRRHRPGLPASRRHRRPRPREPARDLGDDPPTGLPLMDPSPRPGADGLHRGRGPRSGDGTPRATPRPTRRTRASSGTPPCDVLLRLRRHPAARPPAHIQTRRRRSSVGGPRRRQRVTCELNPWALFLGNDWATSSARLVRALLLGAGEARAAVWEGLRRHDRHDLHRPRAAHPRGEGARLDQMGSAHRHSRPSSTSRCSSTPWAGRSDARAGGRRAAGARPRPSGWRDKGRIEVGSTPTSRSSTSTRRGRSRRHRPVQDRLDAVCRPRLHGVVKTLVRGTGGLRGRQGRRRARGFGRWPRPGGRGGGVGWGGAGGRAEGRPNLGGHNN